MSVTCETTPLGAAGFRHVSCKEKNPARQIAGRDKVSLRARELASLPRMTVAQAARRWVVSIRRVMVCVASFVTRTESSDSFRVLSTVCCKLAFRSSL